MPTIGLNADTDFSQIGSLENDGALNNRLEALPTIGLRTLLGTIMVEKIGDNGSFAKNVKKFTEEGCVTKK